MYIHVYIYHTWGTGMLSRTRSKSAPGVCPASTEAIVAISSGFGPKPPQSVMTHTVPTLG